MKYSDILLICTQYLNIPYIWGEERPLVGLDCSGLVYNILKDLKITKRRLHSQGYYNYFLSKNLQSKEPDLNCILFFGKDERKISHIAFALNDKLMIEAGGCNARTTLRQHAIDKDARVRIVPIKRRRDLIASFDISSLIKI